MADPLAEVELLIQDGTVLVGHGERAGRETKHLMLASESNDRFLDGPASRRVAVVDFDPATGAPLPPPARFEPINPAVPTRGRFAYDGDPTSASTLAVNAFGTVFQTIRMFEGLHALGRSVRWAFGSEQLLVVPRAGEWANAFYDRSSRSLQFFWFPAAAGTTVYTALSRDIVAHECGHALLDAVVPSLYDSATPQSIAIHEAIADLVAVLMALDSRSLRTAVLERSHNTLAGANAFNGIAEEFGMARPGPEGVARRALRDLHNQSTLTDLAGARPHTLSTLLSAVFYETLSSIFTAVHEEEIAKGSASAAAAANKALGRAHIIFRRLLLRGIDYLPPGELSFADVGRATLAADRAVLSDNYLDEAQTKQRQAFATRFADRQCITSVEDLDGTRPEELAVPAEQIAQLHDSDWAAYDYITRHRHVLGIPPEATFTVLPRIDATKATGSEKDGVVPTQRELILKVAWDHVEESTPTQGATRRHVPTGATVVLGWTDGRCLALVTSDVTADSHRQGRDNLLTMLDEDGLLDLDGGVGLHVSGGVATLRGTQRLLHLAGWEQ